MKPLGKNRNLAIIPLSIIVSLIMVYLTVINYLDYSDTLISNEQRRLLAVADAIARSIEENVGSNSVYLNIVVGDTSFVKTMYALHEQSSDNINPTQTSEMEQILQRFMKVNNSGIMKLTIFSPKSELMLQYPADDPLQLTPKEADEMKSVVESRLPKVGDTYFPEEGSPYYTIYMPVFSNSEFLGVLRGKISTDYIYDKLVKPVELGIVGYASVKTNETKLLMHPSSGDIGQELMPVRRGRFPQYDWSELERVVNEQLTHRRGVSIYHSVWAGDESGQRVKKFSAYSSADIGDDFWIVTISADYKQVVEIIHKNYYITLITLAMIFIAVIFALINTLVTRQRQRHLEESIDHNIALEKLNVELAEDIRQREILQRELTKMLNKYTAIFVNTKDCIFIIDFSDKHVGHLIEQNVKALEVFGYPDEDVSTLTLEQLDLDHDKEDLEERFGSLDIGNSTLYETVLVSQKGVKVPVEAQCSVFELDGKRRLLYIARDISQRKQEEQILIRSERRFMSIVNELATRMKDENYEVDTVSYDSTTLLHQKLEQINIQLEHMFKKELDENRRKESLMLIQSKNAAMGEMIGNIAHQWRQPLNTLNFILNNMMDELRNCRIDEASSQFFNSKFKKGFNIINKMSDTIDDFRHFFKPQDSKKVFNLSETIELVLNMFEERIKLYSIEVEVLNHDSVMCYGYSSHLAQVLLNMINNSIDAHKIREEKTGITYSDKKIEIDYSINGDMIEITLSDNAGGIEEEVIKYIFDPYFTTKDMQNGTGLGLYMSKTIIEKHFDGTLEVVNKNEGALFTITLKHSLEVENER